MLKIASWFEMKMYSTSEHCFSIHSAVCKIIIMMLATLYMLSALLFIDHVISPYTLLTTMMPAYYE